MQNHILGYTLIELIITLTIIGISSAFAVPAISHLYARHQAKSLLNQLFSALTYARTTALQLGQNSTLCPKGEAPRTCGKDWSHGWWIFQGKLPHNEPILSTNILKTHTALPTNMSLEFRAFPRSHFIQFNALGQLKGNGKFTLLLNGSSLCFNNQLIMSKTGRMRLTTNLAGCQK